MQLNGFGSGVQSPLINVTPNTSQPVKAAQGQKTQLQQAVKPLQQESGAEQAKYDASTPRGSIVDLRV